MISLDKINEQLKEINYVIENIKHNHTIKNDKINIEKKNEVLSVSDMDNEINKRNEKFIGVMSGDEKVMLDNSIIGD